MMLRVFGMLLALVLAMPLAASAQKPIKVGVPLPLSGPPALFGEPASKGALMFVEELNAKGGVLGQKIEIVSEDDETKPAPGESVESVESVQTILDQHLELPVDGNVRQPGVARLLQSFDQQRPVTVRRQHVRVEVVSLHPVRVGQDDPPDSHGGDLCPEPAHHLRSREGKDQVDAWTGRHDRFERAVQLDRSIADGLHRAHATRAIDDADAHAVPGRDLQDTSQVIGACARKGDVATIVDLARLEKNHVHVR